MEKIKEYSESYFLSAGETNAEREMSLTLLVAKLIDIATAHANHLGIGNPYMPDDHSGWVLSRLTIEMERYPIVDDTYTITTWVESWNRHFSERAFRISDASGNTLGYARSIWMVLDTVTRANAGLSALDFREEYISDAVCPIARQAKHAPIVLPDEDAGGKAQVANHPAALYRFGYCDLDAYRHVNTVRYVFVLMNRFSLAEHDERFVSRLELSFLHEGRYGHDAEILRHEASADEATGACNAFLLRDSESKTPILYARVFMKRRISGIPGL